MFCYVVLLILFFAGSFGARKTETLNTHIIRPFQAPLESHSPSNLNHLSLGNQITRTNDYDDSSSRLARLRAPMHIVHAPKTTSSNHVEDVFKTYQPREDPKLYYQSEAYLKEINGQSINKEVTYIYPGWEVIRAGEKYRIPKHLLRSIEDHRKPKVCVRCPHNRTLIAKIGAEKVIFQSPVLTTCSGRKVPRSIRLVHMYGPKFGTLLPQGSYVLVGRLMHKNETLRLCKLHVHVVTQSCSTPKHLLSHCLDRNKPCNFTCRDETLKLQGKSALVCGEDMKWEGHLPVCRARNSCKPLSLPSVGEVSCRSATTDYSLEISEGTRCRIRCPLGWRWSPKAVTVCRRGSWTNVLQCLPKKNMLR
ncbi:uncharacterized protein LOC123877672 isoform X2 [Maniola jurtina]|uniref:uncharacterized protein LOC123877672 isoform X2 n=1 Tax=Maniola jurtina TaxID=191418 RepID=UPI001E68CAF6|nr:uncharacterized protein LOC123877672 isoform X2 [Maniola jurtina]